MNVRLSLVAAAITAAVAAPTFAASSASASIGPLVIELIDLDLQDNVTPWVAFATLGSSRDSYVYAHARQSNPYAFDAQEVYGNSPWAPSSWSASAGVSHGTASLSGPGDAAGTTLSASGYAGDVYSADPNDSAYFNAGVFAPYSNVFNGGLTLSANTRLVISGAASVAAAATRGGNALADDSANAYAWLRVFGDDGFGGTQLGNDYLDTGLSSPGVPFTVSSSRLLNISFVNPTNGDLNASFYMAVGTSGVVNATPVPEPETCALMLTGLLAVGFAVRARSS